MEIQLKDVIKIKHGFAFKGEHFSDEETGYAVLTPGNFSLSGGFQETDKFYDSDDFPKEFVLSAGDLIVTMTDLSKEADTIGYAALVPENSKHRYLHNQRIGLVTVFNPDFEKEYLYWLMRSPHYQRTIANSSNGATVHHTSPEKICRYRFEKRSKRVQSRIATILSTYDKLIEVNNKRIKVLEQMAENLYKEWFVRFRFPGHESTGFIDSKLGIIPDSFSIIRMQDAFDYYIGGGWGNDDPDEDFSVEAYVIRGTDFPRVSKGDVSSCPLRYHKKSNYDARKLSTDDLILEVSGGTAEQPVGRTLLLNDSVLSRLDDKVICASFCKLIRLRKSVISPLYFYYWMQFLYDTRIIDRFQLQSTGIINFQFEYFLRKGEILLPTKTIMDDFDARVRRIHGEIAILAEQNEKLIQQRDLLLPRLMSGKLEV